MLLFLNPHHPLRRCLPATPLVPLFDLQRQHDNGKDNNDRGQRNRPKNDNGFCSGDVDMDKIDCSCGCAVYRAVHAYLLLHHVAYPQLYHIVYQMSYLPYQKGLATELLLFSAFRVDPFFTPEWLGLKKGSVLKTLKSNNSVAKPFWIRLIAHLVHKILFLDPPESIHIISLNKWIFNTMLTSELVANLLN